MEEEKEMKILLSKTWLVFFWEAFLYCLVLGLGILTALKLKEILKIRETIPSPLPLSFFLLAFVLATLFIVLIARSKRIKKGKPFLFKTVFILGAVFGGLIFFSLWLGDVFGLMMMAILIIWWLRAPSILVHNLLVMLGIIGIGVVLGLRFSPLSLVIILVILSVYDFIAVYKTKHMVKMAKEMIKSGTILALIVPSKISDLKAGVKEVRAGGKFLILGGGDVAFPLLLCVSLVPEGILDSFIVAIFSILGLSASFWIFISQKIRAPIPALPPIALFSIIGYLITLLI